MALTIAQYHTLSAQQVRFLGEYARGYTLNEIAERNVVAYTSVREQFRRIRLKLAAPTNATAVLKFNRLREEHA